MLTWAQFAHARPDLAEAGRRLMYQFGVGLAFLATVRADGAPRLHPICPLLTDQALLGFLQPSPKRHDLHRDGRYALHAFPSEANEDAFYLCGPRPAAAATGIPATQSGGQDDPSFTLSGELRLEDREANPQDDIPELLSEAAPLAGLPAPHLTGGQAARDREAPARRPAPLAGQSTEDGPPSRRGSTSTRGRSGPAAAAHTTPAPTTA
jgi:hypothetical protein